MLLISIFKKPQNIIIKSSTAILEVADSLSKNNDEKNKEVMPKPIDVIGMLAISTNVVQEMFKVQMVTILACFNQVEVTNTNLLKHDDRAAMKYSREKLNDLEDRSHRNNLRME